MRLRGMISHWVSGTVSPYVNVSSAEPTYTYQRDSGGDTGSPSIPVSSGCDRKIRRKEGRTW